MLEVQRIEANLDVFTEGLTKRGIPNPESLLKEVIALNKDRKETQTKLDETLSQSNNLSRQIGALMKEGKKQEAEEVKTQTAKLKETSKELTERLATISDDLRNNYTIFPNVPHATVVEGNSSEQNEVISQSEDLPDLGDAALPHWELIVKHDIIDFELGNKITAADFRSIRGKGARLQRALVNYFLDRAHAEGYAEVQPPVLINEDSGYATGQLPDKEGQMYELVDSKLFLIPTAEVPITNLVQGRYCTEGDAADQARRLHTLFQA